MKFKNKEKMLGRNQQK